MENRDLRPKDFMVLLVEDDEAILSLLSFSLKHEGFVFEVAKDGEEAKEKFTSVSPDLIIADLMLPKVGGYELIRFIRSQPSGREVPVIVITAKKLDDASIEMLKFEMKVKEILLKPFAKITLISLVYQALGIKWADMGTVKSGGNRIELEIEKNR